LIWAFQFVALTFQTEKSRSATTPNAIWVFEKVDTGFRVRKSQTFFKQELEPNR